MNSVGANNTSLERSKRERSNKTQWDESVSSHLVYAAQKRVKRVQENMPIKGREERNADG